MMNELLFLKLIFRVLVIITVCCDNIELTKVFAEVWEHDIITCQMHSI